MVNIYNILERGEFMDRERILEERLRTDEVYQDLLRECTAAEDHYIRLLSSLSDTDRAVVERYLSACEELDHRRFLLAVEV